MFVCCGEKFSIFPRYLLHVQKQHCQEKNITETEKKSILDLWSLLREKKKNPDQKVTVASPIPAPNVTANKPIEKTITSRPRPEVTIDKKKNNINNEPAKNNHMPSRPEFKNLVEDKRIQSKIKHKEELKQEYNDKNQPGKITQIQQQQQRKPSVEKYNEQDKNKTQDGMPKIPLHHVSITPTPEETLLPLHPDTNNTYRYTFGLGGDLDFALILPL